MSIESVIERTFHITATCDHCGVVKTWDQKRDWGGTADVDIGFAMMRDPMRYDRGALWFHEAACVRAYVDANVVAHLRYPEGVAS